MLKKIVAIAFSVISLLYLWVVNSTPIFNGYSSSFEIYQKENSSSAQIISVFQKNIWNYPLRYGEACVVEKDGFNAYAFLESLDANLLGVEESKIGTSYYAYSPKIKYCKQIKDKKVNLHVFVGKDKIKVGSPLIFGSY